MSDSSYTVSNVSYPAMRWDWISKSSLRFFGLGKWLITAITGVAAVASVDCPDTSQYIHGKCVAGARWAVGWWECACSNWRAWVWQECHSCGGEDGSRAQLGMQLRNRVHLVMISLSGTISSQSSWLLRRGMQDLDRSFLIPNLWCRYQNLGPRGRRPQVAHCLKRRIKHFPRSLVFRRINRQDT